MRYTSIAGVLVIVAVLFSGCMQTPATVKTAEQTMIPTLLETLFPTAVPTPTEYERPTFSPIRSSVPAPVVASTPDIAIPTEPIIGKWALVGNGNYDCTAIFRDDNTGGIVCSAGYIPILNDQMRWEPVPAEYTFMKSYSVRKINSNQNYTILYSYRKGTLTSELLPENTYLMKLS